MELLGPGGARRRPPSFLDVAAQRELMKIVQRSDQFSTSSQITAEDVKSISEQGYKTIINNRPDFEALSQPLGADLERAAQEHRISYIAYPVTPATLTKDVARKFNEILSSCTPPVLAYCNSGNRSFKLYQLSQNPQSSL
jgi:uncharacterized protein (TIGR01244 family)